ncbi:Flavin-binding monooxygenase-like [Paramyrothecium foliicola]|nr:Flavin-binding monooxygenase-like [Paramyrothecium foliicola]
MAVPEEQPSSARIVPGSVNVPIGKLPHHPGLEVDNAQQVAQTFLNSFNDALQKKDPALIADLFSDNGFWRDHLALTWDFQTVHGKDKIKTLIQQRAEAKGGLRLKKLSLDTSSPAGAPNVAVLNLEGTASVLQFFVTLETVVGSGRGLVRLVPENGSWKAFTLYTVLQELKDHEEALNSRRPRGVDHGAKSGRKNWFDTRKDEVEFSNGTEPAVLILGAGQAGLTIAARLKALGVPALLIEKNERIGDSWRKRYHQLVLHDPVWYDHLPYLPFPASWPIFTPKDKLADFLESYVKLLELNVWNKSSILEAEYREADGVWDVKVERQVADGSAQVRVFHPRHVIQATGHSGEKNVPDIKGIDGFKGDLLCHSSQFQGAREASQGRKAVIVGSCNSAHDIAQDYFEKGYDVTMVQRSSTCVVTSRSITEIYCKGLYEEGGPAVDDADLIFQSIPLPVFKAVHRSVIQAQLALDKDLLDGLEASGFKLDRGPDDAGLFLKYFQRGGGYYIDVGASELIASKKIKIKQGQEITEILPKGLRFADGTELDADEIVLATGYQNMRTQTRTIFGDKVADRVGDVWGYDEDNEMRAIWRNSGHPGFWFHGGNLAFCRYYSKLLALQIKALEEGLQRQYGDQ